MNTKVESFTDNKTWVFTILPQSKKEICCKWVYETKFKDDDTIKRHKASLVAKGFNQV